MQPFRTRSGAKSFLVKMSSSIGEFRFSSDHVGNATASLRANCYAVRRARIAAAAPPRSPGATLAETAMERLRSPIEPAAASATSGLHLPEADAHDRTLVADICGSRFCLHYRRHGRAGGPSSAL